MPPLCEFSIVLILVLLFQTIQGEPVAAFRGYKKGLLAPPNQLKLRSVIPTGRPLSNGFSTSVKSNASTSSTNPSASTTSPPITSAYSIPNKCEMDYEGHIAQMGNMSQTHCTGTTTVAGPALTGLLRDCPLWDKSCHGNRTAAVNDFYENELTFLQENACFVNDTIDCKGIESDELLRTFPKIKEWMRSPDCDAGFFEYQRMKGNIDDFQTNETMICCNTCYITAADVDIYYWPEANADTSCLSIIGDHVNPPLFEATTDVNETTYWGCTPTAPVSGKSIITTARMTSIGSVTFKQSLYNPWNGDPCESTSPVSNTISATPTPSLQARGHSLIVTGNGSNGTAQVVTSDGFTL